MLRLEPLESRLCFSDIVQTFSFASQSAQILDAALANKFNGPGTLNGVTITLSASVKHAQTLDVRIDGTNAHFDQSILTSASVNAPGLSAPIQVSKSDEIHKSDPSEVLLHVQYDYTETYGGSMDATDLSGWTGTGQVAVPASANFFSSWSYGPTANYQIQQSLNYSGAKIDVTITEHVTDPVASPAHKLHKANLRLVDVLA